MSSPPAASLDAVCYSAEKSEGYYGNERADLVSALPRPIGRALDVGCGAGAVAKLLRAEGAVHVVGVEVNEDVASSARRALDDLRLGAIEAVLPSLDGPFDTICCYDVLEHLVDPGMVLSELRARAAPGAHLQISVPNARHFSLLTDLIFRGTFGYTGWGHRDSTHLRWFTRRDIVELAERCGWRVIQTSHPALRRSHWLDRATRGRSTEFLVGQWYVLATAAS